MWFYRVGQHTSCLSGRQDWKTGDLQYPALSQTGDCSDKLSALGLFYLNTKMLLSKQIITTLFNVTITLLDKMWVK